MDEPHTGLYVVMGVAGSGKTRIGAALARALGVDFVDGDDHHPAGNVARMAAGIPLDDDHRLGWLRALAVRLGEARDAGRGLVMACSALRRVYRDMLRAGAAPARLRFIHLDGGRALLAARLEGRRGHFMPAALLDSQLATLEPPSPDEDAWVVDILDSPEALVDSLVRRASG